MQLFRRAWSWFVATLGKSSPLGRLIIGFFVGIGLVFFLFPVALLYELITQFARDRMGPASRWAIAGVAFILIISLVSALTPRNQTGGVGSLASRTPTVGATPTPSVTPRPTSSPTPRPTATPITPLTSDATCADWLAAPYAVQSLYAHDDLIFRSALIRRFTDSLRRSARRSLRPFWQR